MAIVQVLDESYFMERFREMGRGDQFSGEALRRLFEYYEEISECTGEHVKLDVIRICLDWYEVSPEEIIQEYTGYDYELNSMLQDALEAGATKEELQVVAIDWLASHTTVLELSNIVLYAAF